jgi:opacity protein-like surface antigen
MGCSKCVLLFGELVLLTAVLLILLPARSKAERFVDLSAGVALTQDAKAKAVGGGDTNVKFATSFSLSGRGGYWFDRLSWLGVAGSLSYFRPSVKVRGECEDEGCKIGNMRAIPLSLLVMARAPLMTSSDYPNGQLQPYIGVGPGLFIADLSPENEKLHADTVVNVGLDARLGAVYEFRPHLGVFGEYAFSYATPRFKVTSEEAQGHETFDVDLTTHRLLAGLRYSF